MRKGYMMKADYIADEVNCLYAKCCVELGLNPNIIHDNINSAPSYDAYYAKCVEYVFCFTNKN